MRCKRCGAPIENGVCTYCGCSADDLIDKQSGQESKEERYEQERKSLYGCGQHVSSCHKGMALVLCLFLGFFGAHQFYAKKYAMGVLYLLTLGLFYIGWIYDIYRIAAGKFRDYNGYLIR